MPAEPDVGQVAGSGIGVERPRDFESAWAEVRHQVYAVCRRRLDNPADADDVFQEVSLRAWRGFPTWRADAPFIAWVMRIAANEVNRRGKRVSDTRGGEQPIHDDTPEPPDPAPGPGETEALDPDASWVFPAVRAAVTAGDISETEAQVVIARYTRPDDDWPVIGEALGLSANACAQANVRALPKLGVYMFTHALDKIGGVAAAAEAFESAQRRADNPLTAQEAEVFRRVVLDGDRDFRQVGWKLALRSAAAKVARRLPVIDR